MPVFNSFSATFQVGHSLGGLLAAEYALKHPSRIDGLVLASPAGLTPPPRPGRTGGDGSGGGDGGGGGGGGSSVGAAGAMPSAPVAGAPGTSHAPDDAPWQYRLLDAAWSANITPGQLFRAWSYLGGGGVDGVESIIRRRFGNRWPAQETNLIASYLYHITAQPGSGEFAMNSLMVRRGGRRVGACVCVVGGGGGGARGGGV